MAEEEVLSWIGNNLLALELGLQQYPRSPFSALSSSLARSSRSNPDPAMYIQLHHCPAMMAMSYLDSEPPPTMDEPKRLPLRFSHTHSAQEAGEGNPSKAKTHHLGACILEVDTFLRSQQPTSQSSFWLPDEGLLQTNQTNQDQDMLSTLVGLSATARL